MIQYWSRFLDWYRAPEQELLRREAAWFRAWLRRPAAIAIFAAFAASHLAAGWASGVQAMWSPDKPWPYASWLSHVPRGAFISGWVITYGTMAWLILRRSLAPFRRGRLGELVLTRIQPRDLWPSLPCAPFCASAIFAGISSASEILFILADRIGALPLQRWWVNFFSSNFAMDGRQADSSLLFVAEILSSISPIISLIVGLARGAAFAALVSAVALPARSLARFGSAFILGLALLANLGWIVFGFLFPVLMPLLGGMTLAWVAQVVTFGDRFILLALLGIGMAQAARRRERFLPWPAIAAMLLACAAEVLPQMALFFGAAGVIEFLDDYSMGFLLIWGRVVVFNPFFSLCLSAVVLTFSLRRLRGEELWNDLRLEAGRD